MASIARSFGTTATRLTTRSLKPTPSYRFRLQATRAFSTTIPAPAKKYTKDHEWVELSEDKKSGTIGISSYAAHALGDVVYVELPATDLEVAAGDMVGAVESVKSASDINSPISCKVLDVNSFLEEKPAMINHGPEDDGANGGWVARIEATGDVSKELENLMSAEEYKKFTSEE